MGTPTRKRISSTLHLQPCGLSWLATSHKGEWESDAFVKKSIVSLTFCSTVGHSQSYYVLPIGISCPSTLFRGRESTQDIFAIWIPPHSGYPAGTQPVPPHRSRWGHSFFFVDNPISLISLYHFKCASLIEALSSCDGVSTSFKDTIAPQSWVWSWISSVKL